jgi:hypothetical protein
MHHIKMLAPTIIDALQALEKGCRKKDDPHFRFELLFWLSVTEQKCYGCLATATLMQLTNKTGKDLIEFYEPRKEFIKHIEEADRANAYAIEYVSEPVASNDFRLFETAIDALREANLLPLLEFYQLANHINAPQAVEWLYHHQPFHMGFGTNGHDLEQYADFLHATFIPLLQNWFCGTE